MKYRPSNPIGHNRSGVWLAVVALLVWTATVVNAAPQQLPPLTTVSGSPRLPGKFVWADLVTDDVPAARNFYSQLFGWTMHSVGNYTIAANDGRPLCGMFQKPRPADPNAKPRWFGYISVANVDRAQKAVVKAGGKVLAAPQKMPKRGEQAVFADAEGAIFGVVRSSAGDPEDFLPDPGDWIWIQLFSHDAKKASEFYKGVGGYEVIANNSTNRLSDFILANEGYARATVRTIPVKDEGIRPNWLLFARVKSVGEAVAKAKLLGGKVLIEPKADVFEGKVAVVADPTGAAIGLLEWSAELAKGAR
jgi:predicted enzyme related to lactoylglutathione lyase